MSGGRFDLVFHEPGALAPSSEIFGAVSAGTIDAGWTTPGFHTRTLGDGITFFTTVPFGPNLGEFLAWKQHGGGQELREELYNAHGVTSLDTVCTGPESSGWFKEEITDPARQLPGLKMRFFGLGAEVMQKMGVSMVSLAGRDILPALRSGEIDATEFSMPMVDIDFRLHEEAKYNYFPGWHQRVSCGELLMNEQRYNALPEAYKSMLKAAATEQITVTIAETEAENPVAMREMEARYGVEYRHWRDETLRQFEAAWEEVVAEKSASDAGFKKIADSYFAFREAYRIWGEAQAMKVTYLDDEEPATPSTIRFPLFMAKDDTRGLQGFARITNLSDESGTVTIDATDDAGMSGGEVLLSLDALQTRHFNSDDLEDGNSDKGLTGSTGDGSGNWRLELATDLDIEARAFVRTSDGFVTAMHERVPAQGGCHHVPFFNPGSNRAQVSRLRLVNPTGDEVKVAIAGRDDVGAPAPGGAVRLTLAPGEARTLTAQALEAGGDGLAGSLGDGTGKWQLFVTAGAPVEVMNLLASPTGHLTNLSAPGLREPGGGNEAERTCPVEFDPAPRVPRIADVGAEEGEALTFTVTLDRAPSDPLTWYYATYPGTAGSGDYDGHFATALRFARGERTKTITVQTTEDTEVEDDETFYVYLTESAGELTDSTPSRYLAIALGTIRDDDADTDLGCPAVNFSEFERRGGLRELNKHGNWLEGGDGLDSSNQFQTHPNYYVPWGVSTNNVLPITGQEVYLVRRTLNDCVTPAHRVYFNYKVTNAESLGQDLATAGQRKAVFVDRFQKTICGSSPLRNVGGSFNSVTVNPFSSGNQFVTGVGNNIIFITDILIFENNNDSVGIWRTLDDHVRPFRYQLIDLPRGASGGEIFAPRNYADDYFPYHPAGEVWDVFCDTSVGVTNKGDQGDPGPQGPAGPSGGGS